MADVIQASFEKRTDTSKPYQSIVTSDWHFLLEAGSLGRIGDQEDNVRGPRERKLLSNTLSTQESSLLSELGEIQHIATCTAVVPAATTSGFGLGDSTCCIVQNTFCSHLTTERIRRSFKSIIVSTSLQDCLFTFSTCFGLKCGKMVWNR